MPRFAIHHVTKYNYDAAVRDSANQILLFPIRDHYQELLKQDLTITGDPELDLFKDYYGNEVGSFMNSEPHLELVIDSKLQIATKPREMFCRRADQSINCAMYEFPSGCSTGP